MTAPEFESVRKGVEQRARAIRAFLSDYHAGGIKWSQIIPKAVLSTIMSRHHIDGKSRKTTLRQISFPYGPDIMRDGLGRWKVIEDSAGLIGGLGDLTRSREVLYRTMPTFRDFLSGPTSINDPDDFFTELTSYFSEKAWENGGIPLLYLHPYKMEVDGETRRLSDAFSRHGIESTTSTNRSKQVLIQEGNDAGIFLITKSGRERIGALILRSFPEQFGGRSVTINLQKLAGTRSESYSRQIVRTLLRQWDQPSAKQLFFCNFLSTQYSSLVF